MSEPTFEAMCEHSPFELAERWADRTHRPVDQDTHSVVEELAVMSALGQWLRQRVPGTMHRALLSGVDVEQVANATGLNSADVLVEWTRWALQQRELYEQKPPGDRSIGLSLDEYERVREAIHGTPDTSLP